MPFPEPPAAAPSVGHCDRLLLLLLGCASLHLRTVEGRTELTGRKQAGTAGSCSAFYAHLQHKSDYTELNYQNNLKITNEQMWLKLNILYL